MFRRKTSIDPNVQIPYPMYQTLRANSTRRWRWVLEVVIAAIIVLVLALGGVWLLRFVRSAKQPVPTHSSSAGNSSSNAPDVTQSPQQNTNTQPKSQPATVPGSNTTNNSSVTAPSGN